MAGAGATYVKTAGEGPVPQWHGVYLGYIAVNQDPTAQGRVKLRVPQVFGGVTSGWAAPAVPLTYIPKVGTAAYVMFAGGDPSQPVWFGNFALPDSASGIIYSATEPLEPTLGEVWFNTTDGLTSEWNGAGWVAYQIGGGAVQSGIGLSEPDITGGTITGAQFIGDGTGNEFVLYNGTPTADNLVASVVSETASDGHGNQVLAGTSLYGSIGTVDPLYVALQMTGFRNLLGESDPNGFALSPQLSATGMTGWGTTPDPTAPYSTWGFQLGSIIFYVYSGGSQIYMSGGVTVTGDLTVAGTITAAGGVAAVDTWHSLGTCGSTGCTLEQARYRLTPDGECEIDIALLAGGGGSTAGTYTFSNTLPTTPANYQFPGSYLRIYDLSFNANITTGTENSIVAVDGNGTGSPGRVRITIPALASGVCLTCTTRIPLN